MRRSAARTAPGGRVSALSGLPALLVLLGLLAMHGLSDHGAHVEAPAWAASGPAAHAGGLPGAGEETHAPAQHGPDGPDPGAVVTGLCLAVLLLVAARAVRRARRSWPVSGVVLGRSLPVPFPAGARPRRPHPPAYALQVVRC